MFLGIEIGGTKLQLGVGQGDGSAPVAMLRAEVEPDRGATGILQQIDRLGTGLLQQHPVTGIGIGFGGPVDCSQGKVVKSHQIAGWHGFHLAAWCRKTFGLPAVLGNDCDLAALAEARFGAGQQRRTVFYVTVGTGVGGGLVMDGQLYGQGKKAVAEIGHLRPGLHADRPEMTVEAVASGWGIAAEAQARVTGEVVGHWESLRRGPGPVSRQQVRRRLADVEQADEEYVADLMQRCGGDLDLLTAKLVAQAAAEGNLVAAEVLHHACQALGWAIAQIITLLAPEVVVVGGGVSLIGQQFFFTPLRSEVARYVFPPLLGSYQIVPATLGELVVVHGALARAADQDE